MATEQSKSPGEQPAQAAAVPAYPQPYGGPHFAPLPQGAYPPPPYYTYAPMPDPNHDPNAPNSAPMPYLMAFAPPPPPGMVYAYAPPPPGQVPYTYPPPPPAQAAAQVGPPAPRPKRKQVKMACTNCANACKRCDDARPCERCIKYGVADSCVDGVRKERKKGIKRGPYKRKSKTSNGDVSYPEIPELHAPAAPPAEPPAEPASAQPGPYAAQPVPPEGGYYPYYYPHPYLAPPPPGPGPDAPPSGEGSPNGNGNGHAVAHPPYYPLHPAVYPYPPYTHPPPLAYAAPPHALMAPPPSTPDTNGKGAEDPSSSASAAGKGKKRARKSGEDGSANRTKKTKEFHVEGNTSTNGFGGSGASQADLSSHGPPVNGVSANGNGTNGSVGSPPA